MAWLSTYFGFMKGGQTAEFRIRRRIVSELYDIEADVRECD